MAAISSHSLFVSESVVAHSGQGLGRCYENGCEEIRGNNITDPFKGRGVQERVQEEVSQIYNIPNQSLLSCGGISYSLEANLLPAKCKSLQGQGICILLPESTQSSDLENTPNTNGPKAAL